MAKKILVLGLSKSGVSAAKLARKRGNAVYITESKEIDASKSELVSELNNLGIFVEGGGHSEKFVNGTDLVITSPGIPPHSEIMQRLNALNIPIISEIEYAYNESDTPFIIITGTNGKTTTTALTEFVLAKSLNVRACGNIGKPPCDLADDNLDYFVCEASSFQLEMSPTLSPCISVWTNFTPDHIDWHQGLENYFNAKAKVFKGEQTPAYSVLNAKDEKLAQFAKTLKNTTVFMFGEEVGENCCYSDGKTIIFKQEGLKENIIDIAECPLVGEHNYQNIMCAIICAKLTGLDNATIKSAIMEFKAPAHRLEKVAQDKGITFYNDSKATNPEASIVAINSFNDMNVVLIAGGRDKNTDLTEFCESVKGHIKTVILIGEATERFEQNLLKNGFDNIIREKTMQSAIDKGIDLHPEVLLLSPACASFDMFSGYEERGDVFRDYVLSRI